MHARATPHWLRRLGTGSLLLLLSYLLVAYVVAPVLWTHYEHQPALSSAPKTALTPEDIPADPLNIGLVGTQAEVIQTFVAAGWTPADPLTFRSSVGIVASVALREPDPTAPVSTLDLWGRRQDLAFEREVGTSAQQRRHVRLWRAPAALDVAGRPFWLGAVTFDTGVELSRRTGEVTHRIAPDVDAERDTLIATLTATGLVLRTYDATGVGTTLRGRNGNGDWYYTDGELTVAVLTPGSTAQPLPTVAPNPLAVALKQRGWAWLRPWLPHAP
jgi:hypothetical protein